MVGDRFISTGSNFSSESNRPLSQLVDLIATTLGIRLQPHHQETLREKIISCMKASGCSSLPDFCQQLTAPEQTARNAAWQVLIEALTITESYFFRDQGQFELLRNQILPELIERKRRLSPAWSKPSLRLWSAGCSTGEEAYSLAILVQELLPDYQAWNLLILATDINQPSIEIAQQGIYRDWSFRLLAPETKHRYFRQHKKGWEIDPTIRKMVSFRPGNLVKDPYPDAQNQIDDLDLILCRNVFIYFDAQAISLVLEKFYHALAPGGVLLTGHTELHGQSTEKFQVISLPKSVVYQHPVVTDSLHPNASKLNLQPPVLKKLEKTEQNIIAQKPDSFSTDKKISGLPLISQLERVQKTLLEQAKQLLGQKAYAEVIQVAKHLISLDPHSFQTYCLMAEAYANLGYYADANQAGQQAIQRNPLAIEPYLILADVAEEQGDLNAAKHFLKRVIYLCPTSAQAYFELGCLYEQEGNKKQAQKTWRSLLEILKNLPPEQGIDANQKMTVAELQIQVLKNLAKVS